MKIDLSDLEKIEIEVIKDDEIKEKYGVIIMLDSLGTKNLSLIESKTFIKNINFIVKIALEYSKKNLPYHEINLDLWSKIILEDPKIFAFQDTIIIAIATHSEKTTIKLINFIGEFLAQIIVTGIKYNIFFRGAISIGNYVEYNNQFYLGEAISDVANWYEKTDWIGIVFTPNTGKLLNLIKQCFADKIETDFKLDEETFNWLFTYAQAPLKEKFFPLWIVNWAFGLLGNMSETGYNHNPLAEYYNMMRNAKIPYGTENKYINTNNFVEWYFKQFPGFLKNEINIPELKEKKP